MKTMVSPPSFRPTHPIPTQIQPLTTVTAESSAATAGRDPKEGGSMAARELQKLAFSSDLDLVEVFDCSGDRELEGRLVSLRRISVEARERVVAQRHARRGRDLQRWGRIQESADDAGEESEAGENNGSGVRVRYTTGTIPILSDGRLLLVSSSRHRDQWIFPKGGWELDESAEESAIRETFEEAGITGILGPPLPATTYETRKARRRRLTNDEGNQHREHATTPPPPAPAKFTSPLSSSSLDSSTWGTSVSSRNCSYTALDTLAAPRQSTSPKMDPVGGETNLVTPFKPESSSSNETREEKNKIGVKHYDHTHNNMTLFPLYVQRVYSQWPEMDRRGRRAVSVEEAEALLSLRPEFVSLLKTLQERSWHQLPVRKRVTGPNNDLFSNDAGSPGDSAL
jgi:diphosphoinositol-polyphosphate diphosphatase